MSIFSTNRLGGYVKRHPQVLPLLVLLILVTALASSAYILLKNQKLNELSLEEVELLSQGGVLLSRELGALKRMTLFLRNTVESSLLLKGVEREEGKWRQDTLNVFTQFAKTSSLISQVRWLDLEGEERLRLNISKGKQRVVDSSELQHKASRYYFQQARYAIGDNVYISPIDLNVENGDITYPLEPTVRAVITLKPELGGILVVNYNLTDLLRTLRGLADDTLFLDVVNLQGEWIVNQDKSKEWAISSHTPIKGKQKGHINNDGETRQYTLPAVYPSVWESIELDDKEVGLVQAGQVWSIIPVSLKDDSAAMNSGQEQSLLFVARTWPNIVPQYLTWLLIWVLSISTAVYLVMAWFVWWRFEVNKKQMSLVAELKAERKQLSSTNNELILANKQLVMLQDELVETNRLSSLGMMVAGLAHEMNTPLGGIKMSLSSLAAVLSRVQTELADNQYKMLESSLNIADKNLSRAIELVSSFKRLTSNQTEKQASSFDFSLVMQDLLLTYAPILKKTPKIKVETHYQPHISMQGHPGILIQVMQNLIDNALNYAFSEGEKGAIKITAAICNDSDLELCIEDDGKGIDDQLRASLFDPFVTTGREHKHTGLGLYLVHQWVCKLMGGHIDVSSEVGKGTRFTLLIPLQTK